MFGIPRILLALQLVLLAAGCSKLTVDRSGRPCDNQQACIDGYTCDVSTNTCIATGDSCDDPGRQSPCDPTVTNCRLGCRTCTNNAWTECAPVQGTECTPGTTTCENDVYVVCSDNGYIVEQKACLGGCNTEVSPIRCNECVPSTTTCTGNTFVTCDANGLIATSENCGSVETCTDRGVCDPTAGCQTIAQAADGTPCDEGDGDDGNLCNSSCQGGTCTNIAPTCDDGNECTVDSCSDVLGCEHVLADEGTPCAGTDGDFCTSTCNAIGSCQDGLAVSCDDANPCTVDTCDPSNGACDSAPGNAGAVCRAANGDCDAEEFCDGVSADCPADSFVAAGEECGSPLEDECTKPDTCDGAGTCVPNHAEQGTACGLPGECEIQDTCDGAGTCVDSGFAIAGTPCGDPTNNECDKPDTCDGTGVCLPNFEPETTICGTLAITACDAPDTCNGKGTCVTKFAPAGLPCGKQDECSVGDTCDGGGTCTNNGPNSGAPCGKQGGCAVGDVCNDQGACIDKGFLALGAICGHETATQCREPDTCDPDNVCSPNPKSNGTLCDDCAFRTTSDGKATTPCEGTCLGGECPACDGSSNARECLDDSDCGKCATQGVDCTTAVCLKREHFACSDTESPNGWGDLNACQSATCHSGGHLIKSSGLGKNCSATNGTASITYGFRIDRQSGPHAFQHLDAKLSG